MTPSVAVTLLFTIFVLPKIVSDATWETDLGQRVSEISDKWWSFILHIENFFFSDKGVRKTRHLPNSRHNFLRVLTFSCAGFDTFVVYSSWHAIICRIANNSPFVMEKSKTRTVNFIWLAYPDGNKFNSGYGLLRIPRS